MTPAALPINDLIQATHRQWAFQIQQRWNAFAQLFPHQARRLQGPQAIHGPVPVSFILNWHDAVRWPLPQNL